LWRGTIPPTLVEVGSVSTPPHPSNSPHTHCPRHAFLILILDCGSHIRRRLRRSRCIWISRLEKAHCRPPEDSELGHSSAIPGKNQRDLILKTIHPARVCLITSPAGPLWSTSPRYKRCAQKQNRRVAIPSRNDPVQRVDIPACTRPAEIQVRGPSYADWRFMLDRRLGCACIWQENTIRSIGGSSEDLSSGRFCTVRECGAYKIQRARI
jgi:hypothetical protein